MIPTEGELEDDIHTTEKIVAGVLVFIAGIVLGWVMWKS